ncbi:electron transfer flavoprotein subunit beta/FixA family protein [candidate division CSSED10-310 bacterium]|uniref:Electron transfer flavoprotein subunit beta/FixA family protein n=1 Tax=candidate division CSSED10-310 bacterium TaxID=2855610 RepID=A0ABV6Z2K1_UNCC1
MMTSIHTIVCIKPVPDPNLWDKLKLDPETMLLCRDDVPPVINPLDRNALEQALFFKEKFRGKVSVITMAPPNAEEQLLEALAMGCDDAYLLTDRAFAGADTLATARCLKTAIEKIGSYDLIFCGGYSLDGSTAQVGPQIAELLGIPDLIHTIQIEIDETVVRAHCKREEGFAVYETDLPVLVTFDKEVNRPRMAHMKGIKQAMQKGITVWAARDLNLSADEVGLKGSPTQMLNIYTPSVRRKGEILQGSPNEVVVDLISKLKKEKIT